MKILTLTLQYSGLGILARRMELPRLPDVHVTTVDNRSRAVRHGCLKTASFSLLPAPARTARQAGVRGTRLFGAKASSSPVLAPSGMFTGFGGGPCDLMSDIASDSMGEGAAPYPPVDGENRGPPVSGAGVRTYGVSTKVPRSTLHRLVDRTGVCLPAGVTGLASGAAALAAASA